MSHVLHRLIGYLSSFLGWLWPALFFLFLILPLLVFLAGFLAHPWAALARTYGCAGELTRLGLIFLRSVGIAALAAGLALACAVLAFTALEHLHHRPLLRRVAWTLFLLPLFLPGHVIAIAGIQTGGFAGWLTALLGRHGLPSAWLPALLYSAPGCAWVMALHDWPVALVTLWAGRRAAGGAALDSGLLLLRPAVLWRALLTGWLRPWLAIGGLLVFLLALLDYGVPSLLRGQVFTVEIVSAFNVSFDPAQAMALGLPLVLVSLGVAWLLARLLGRCGRDAPVFARHAAIRPLPPLPSRMRRLLALLAALLVLCAPVLPLVTLLRWAGGWATYRTIIVSARPQLVTSLTWCTVATLATLALAAGLATRGLWTGSSLARRLMGGALLALFALPGSLTGIAQIQFWNRPARPLAAFYDSGLMLPLGLVAATLPIAGFVFGARLRELPPILRETQRLASLGPAARWWRLAAPLLARPAWLAAGLVFVLTMQDVHGTMLLAAPGQETLSIRALTLLHYAPDGLVAAFCLLALAATAAGLALLWGAARLVGCLLGKMMPDVRPD